MKKTHIGWLLRAASIALILIALMASYFSLTDAYGTGSPYFGRTQNMDKWSDPIPMLTAIDLLCISAAILLWRTGSRFLSSANDA